MNKNFNQQDSNHERFINFDFDGNIILVGYNGDIQEEEIEDGMASYLEQHDEDDSYEDIINTLMSSYPNIKFRIIPVWNFQVF